MDDADDDVTRLAIRQALEADDHYSVDGPAHDTHRVTQLRRLGREVAHNLDWRIQTIAIPLADGDTRVDLVITESTPLRDQLMQITRQRNIRNAIRDLKRVEHVRRS